MPGRRPRGEVGLLLMVLLLRTGGVAAHKLQVFAAADGARIDGSTYFSGGGPAPGARIEVRDDQGRLLVELAPDPRGRFGFDTTAPIDHRIRAITADGHQAEWTIKAEELQGAFRGRPSVAAADVKPDVVGAGVSARFDPPNPGAAQAVGGLDPQLEAAIERAVARQIRPVREELATAEGRIRVRDILGGIGYIFGLMGLALWWGNRPRPDRT